MSTKAISVTGFFDELKRRKVYRVAVGYVIAAGGVIQLASAVFPAWDLPNWTLRLTVLLLLGRVPDRAHSRLGLRGDAERHSDDAAASLR